MSLYSFFQDGCKKTISGLAIRYYNGFTSQSISYSSLAAISTEISMALKERILNNKFIVVVTSSGINVISCLLGILSCNSAFIYLNVGDLKTKSRFIFLRDKLRFSCCLTDSVEVANIFKELMGESSEIYQLAGMEMLVVEHKSEEIRENKLDIAYVVTTSGSTGNPKIVYVPNKSIVPNIYSVVKHFGQNENDVVFLSSPLTFDPSYVQIFTTFSTGSCLFIVDDSVKLHPVKLLHCITEQEKVTVIQATPSMVSLFGDGLKNHLLSDTSHLRILAFGGEKCPNLSTIRKWKSPENCTRIFNIYGITEVSCWATIHEISTSDYQSGIDEITIGTPLDGTFLELRNYNSLSHSGELWIGGTDRVCFIDDEEFKFCDNVVMRPSGDIIKKEETGLMYYVGRTDDMIKRMGKRIHLQEIEKVVMKMLTINSACVIWNDKELLLFVSYIDGGVHMNDMIEDEVKYHEIKIHLLSCLPDYYIPDKIFVLERVPITSHGKADKKKLLGMYMKRRRDIHKLDASQSFLDTIKKYLNISLAQEHLKEKSWAQLGGNSITALTLTSEIQETFTNVGDMLLDKILNGSSLQDALDYIWSCCNVTYKPSKRNVEAQQYSNEIGVKKLKTDGSKNKLTIVEETLFVTSRSSVHILKQRSGDSECTRVVKIKSFTNKSNAADSFLLKLKKVWKFDTRKCVDASPLVLLAKDYGTVFIGSHSHIFFALDLETGSCLWQVELEGRIESSACLSKCGRYVVAACYNGSIYCLNRHNGEINWKYKCKNSVKSSPTVHPSSGLVYVGSHDGHLYALNIESQMCHWSNNLQHGGLFSSPCIGLDNDEIYVASLGGSIFCLKADDGSILWSCYLGKPIFSSPTVNNLYCYVGCVDGFIYAISRERKEMVWRYETGGPIFSSPSIFMSRNKSVQCIVIGSHDKHVHCVCANSGLLIWKSKLDSEIYAVPHIFGRPTKYSKEEWKEVMEVDMVIACSTKGSVYILSLEDGSEITHIDIGAEAFSSPAVVNNSAIIGCRDNFVYCFSIE